MGSARRGGSGGWGDRRRKQEAGFLCGSVWFGSDGVSSCAFWIECTRQEPKISKARTRGPFAGMPTSIEAPAQFGCAACKASRERARGSIDRSIESRNGNDTEGKGGRSKDSRTHRFVMGADHFFVSVGRRNARSVFFVFENRLNFGVCDVLFA